MSEENKAMLHRAWEEGHNKGDMSVIDATHDVNIVSHRPGGDVIGLDAWKKRREDLRRAFPDLHITVEDQISDGDKVASRLAHTGTHKGTFMGVAPTGKRITMTGIVISRIADGKVVEGWGEADLYGLMQQLGAIPS